MGNYINYMGIDTIRFKVWSKGFNTWLDRNGLKLVEYGSSSFSSRNLDSKQAAYINGKKKKKKYTFIGTVQYGNGNQSVIKSIIVTRNNELLRKDRSRSFIIEVAGLHQPHRNNIQSSTYKILNQLLKKYEIYELDIAYDFETISTLDKQDIVDAFATDNESVKEYGKHPATYYLNKEDGKDTVIYCKSGKAELEVHKPWYRIEEAYQIQKENYPNTVKPIKRNKNILVSILARKAEMAAILLAINKLSGLEELLELDKEFLQMQIARLLNLRKPLPMYN